MQEPKQPQETGLKMFWSGLALAAIVVVSIFLLVTIGGPPFHLLWLMVLLVGAVGFGAVFWLLFIGGNNPAQNAAAFRNLPTEEKLAETCAKWPPDDNPYWA